MCRPTTSDLSVNDTTTRTFLGEDGDIEKLRAFSERAPAGPWDATGSWIEQVGSYRSLASVVPGTGIEPAFVAGCVNYVRRQLAARAPQTAPAIDLEQGLRDLYRAYVRLLESGRDRITSLGGDCDPVDVMEQTDIDLRKVLRGIARNPRTLRALVSTGIDFNRALRSLRSCRGFLLGNEVLMPVDGVMVTAKAA